MRASVEGKSHGFVVRFGSCVATGVFFGWIAIGCSSHPTDEQIKQQAAQTTEQVKQDAQQAASTARVAAADAEGKINAVAAGVKEGLQGGGPQSASKLDLNTVSRSELVTLPGISAHTAARIVAGRPYGRAGDLVTRNILTQGQFDRISGRIKVVPPAS